MQKKRDEPTAPAGRRPTERTYLAILAETCPPDAWREIVEKAVSDAKAGNAGARDWLAGLVLGTRGGKHTLHELAAEQAAGLDPVRDDARAESDPAMRLLRERP